MSKQAKIYHNPRCSKSRNALQMLNQKGYQVKEVRYLENPPSAEELAELCQKLACKATDIIRSNEVLFQAMGLQLDDLRDDQAWFELLSQHPKLIQRPIVVIGEQAVIARPTECLETLM
ncbi:arsenate reductase (glutaredoxin) [Thiomicrospira microaerophila]|uniref:arsenate reductase (glutaredoxin) n=1 Tax=Thiomicrospira microaerophila TaxID=406020 RepID=UPI00200E4912|nr:arsenate reductase (glutaredoxin) [Thiomicrospira microaerophila]UQB43299.1 arsenate reductase (glutaredoxin) [Thiomicrospira microaerophila]